MHICMQGTSGQLCSSSTTGGCASSPCVNGDCSNSPEDFTCLCWDGWTGVICDIPLYVDGCASDPCPFSATCVNLGQLGFYECLCPSTRSGPLCEFPRGCFPNPCGTGTCVGEGAPCICPAGTEPPYCDAPDPCEDEPCQNGGTCTAVDSGTDTSTSQVSRTLVQQTSAPIEQDFVCTCSECYEGSLCEEVLVSQSCPVSLPTLYACAP
eukprot:gene5703-biopygen4929